MSNQEKPDQAVLPINRSEKHFAVQWRYLSNWVTDFRADTAKVVLLRLAAEKAKEKAKNGEHKGRHGIHWRAVSIEEIVKRIDEGG